MSNTFDPNQPRAPKGATNGGQWVKTPGGGKRAAGSWTIRRREQRAKWHPSKPPENTVEEDRKRAEIEQAERQEASRQRRAAERFKEGKREAAKRFAEKQREAKAKGLRPPAEIRKELRKRAEAGDKDALNWKGVNVGREGVWRLKGNNFQQKPMAPGDKSPGGKHKLKAIKSGVHEWEAVTPPPAIGAMSPGGKHKWELGKLGSPHWTEVKEDKAVVHARHKALREAKAKEAFKARKNWAAKNLALRRKNQPELPHPEANLKIGDVSPSGKFMWGNKRNKDNKVMRGKGEWRLIPTAQRGKKTAGRMMPRHIGTGEQSKTGDAGRQLGRNVIARPVNPRPPTVNPPSAPKGQTKTSDDGTISVKPIHNRKEGQGIFEKEFVQIEGDGQGILKSNGYGNNDTFNGVRLGFANREVAAYEVDQVLGLNVVPETKSFISSKHPINPRHGPFHSLQVLVPNAKDGERYRASELMGELEDKTEVGRMFLLDCIMGNTDRHGQNWLVSGDGQAKHIHAIDNGLQMMKDTHSSKEMRRKWRCDLGDVGGWNKKLQIGPGYKEKLAASLKDGSLKAIIDRVTAGSDGPPSKMNKLADAVMARAQDTVDNWDSLFD
jgi:hypothetical protein